MADRTVINGLAIVTGAAGGMGTQCAYQLAGCGWHDLLLCDLVGDKLDAVAETLRAGGARVDTLPGDIAHPDFASRFADKIGSREIGACIHTAGVSPPAFETERIFEVNLDASLQLIEVVQPRMAELGALVMIASIAAHLPVSPEAKAAFEAPIPREGSRDLWHFAADANEAYLLSKRAVAAAIRREARAFGQRHARIVSVSPGLIDTPMLRGTENELTVSLLAGAAIPRLGRAEEVASVCVFLCSPGASFITGCDLLVDGGELAGLG